MVLRNVSTSFTIEQQRVEINELAGDVNNIATGATSVGTASGLAAGATGADLTLSGTLTVNGTQTILNTATLEVEDKNIVIAKGSTTDAAANTGGITLKGADDKTITYSSTGDKWVSNKDFEAPNFIGSVAASQLTGDITSTGDLTINTDAFFVDASAKEVGIGTVYPTQKLDVRGNVYIGDDLQTDGAATFAGNTVIGDWDEVSASGEGFTLRSRGQLLQQLKSDTTETSAYVLQKGTTAKVTFTPDGDATFAGDLTVTGTSIFNGGLAEKVNVKTQLAGANACAITDGNVILTTSNEAGNTYPNITGVHSVLSSGEGFSVTVALKVNGSGTINGFYIDSVAQTIEWSGGSAPSAGSAGYDVFTFSAFKTGSGTTDYVVFGAATNYD